MNKTLSKRFTLQLVHNSLLKSFVALALLFHAYTSPANEQVVTLEDFPKEKEVFEKVGQQFQKHADDFWPENIEPSLFGPLVFHRNASESCGVFGTDCERIRFKANTTFTIDAVVRPSVTEDACRDSVALCLYKVSLSSGETAFVEVGQFEIFSDPNRANGHKDARFLQVTPLTPSESWRSAYDYYKASLAEQGVKNGYSTQNVIDSSWGEPIQKSRMVTGRNVMEVWSYRGGQLTFVNGFVTSISTY